MLLLGIGLPLAAPIGAAAAAGGAPEYPKVGHLSSFAGTVHVTVNTSDAPAFVPNSINVSAGTNISLTVANHGSYAHTFTLSRNETVTFPPNITPQNLSLYFQKHPPFVNVTVNASQTVSINFTMNASTGGGRFEFVSLIPYQFQAGMYGFVNVAPAVGGPPLTFFVNTTNDLHFVASILAAPTVASFPVSVVVQVGNLGALAHTFTVSPLANYNLTPANFTTFFTQHPPLANVAAPSGPGAFNTATFVVSSKGTYEFICTIPGHFASGMFGFLYVGVAPANMSAPVLSTAVVQEGVLIGGGALLMIGVLLALVAAFIGRLRGPTSEERKHY